MKVVTNIYIKIITGSIPSLAAGVICGSLMGIGAYQTSHDPKNVALSLGIVLITHGNIYSVPSVYLYFYL